MCSIPHETLTRCDIDPPAAEALDQIGRDPQHERETPKSKVENRSGPKPATPAGKRPDVAAAVFLR
jgi:hypothetical protein